MLFKGRHRSLWWLAAILWGVAVIFFPSAIASADQPAAGPLLVRECSTVRGPICVLFHSTGGDREFRLTDNPAARSIATGFIGDQFGGPAPAAFIYWLTGNRMEPNGRPQVALSVIDLNSGEVRAQISPPEPSAGKDGIPYSVFDTYFGVVRGPDGKRYPFLAPGHRYLKDWHWSYLCMFRPHAVTNPETGCGVGFARYSAMSPNAQQLSGFRHNGGWLEDEDGDGWDDINLPFFHYILVISGRSGRQIALVNVEPGTVAEPDSPPRFDAGRLYGSFTPFRSLAGRSNVLIASGNTVGTFDDYHCNVSRYFAVLEMRVAYQPQTRTLKWVDYQSFGKNIFSQSLSDGAGPRVLRRGDFINKCVHRVSDSVFRADARMITLYNQFITDPPLEPRVCEAQQWREWNTDFLVPEALEAWQNCAKTHAELATGDWNVKVLDLESGATITEQKNAYIWGRLTDFLPNVPETFLLERMRTKVRFDRKSYQPQQFDVVSITSDGRWHNYGALPHNALPVLIFPRPNTLPYSGPVGSSWRGIVEIESRSSAEGLTEIRMRDGSWVGYSQEAQRFILTTRVPHTR